MPSMPLEAPAALEHLLMRCLAAHPVHQAAHQRQRDATGQPQAYFLSPALVAELLPWALDRALLTPQAADQLNYSHLKWEFVWEPLEAVRVISYLSNRSSKRLSSFS